MFRRLSFVLICLLTVSVAEAADIRFPELTGRVVDNAHLLDSATASQIDQQLATYEQQTTNQIVVVTIPDLKDISIEDYGYQLGRQWGIGQKGKDNGALLIVAPKEHKVRIEVGYGLEGELTDAASSLIINRIITPDFKKGDFNGGIQQGVTAMISTLGGTDENALPAKTHHSNGDAIHFWLLFLVFALFLRWLRSGKGGGIAAPFILGSMLGGSGGNDEDEGGGFSGGGGSFGGGGSSGSW